MQKERKGSKMKKLLAMATSLALLATSAIVPMTAAAAEEKEVTKPEKITIMVDTTLVNQANGRDAFEARWEELTGIDLVINQPDHSAYYDVMQQTMATPTSGRTSSSCLLPIIPTSRRTVRCGI